MSITQTFDLNLIPEQAPVVVHCDQYDEGTGRLIIKLFEGDVAYTPTGTASIQGRKPDGHGFQYSATLVGNTVTADLTFQMSCVSGRVRCQVVVTESTGRTGTFAFILDVQPSALPSDTDLSDSDYQLIEQALEAAEDAVEAAEDAEAWAVGERGGVPVDPSDPTYHNNSKYWSDQAASVGDLDDLNDVTITTPSNNQVLTYDANTGDWINANAQSGAAALDDLTDVDITTPSNGQVLQYNSTSQEWENKNLPTPSTPDIDDLGDVTITSPSDGQFLKYDANSGEWVNGSGGGGGATDLDDLTDVSISSPTNGQVLKYNSTSQEWENANESGGGASDLDDLNDVTITTPTDGQALLYDAINQIWKNGNVSGGGGDYMGLYGMTEIQSSDGQGTTLLDLNQYTSVGNYFCDGKAYISTSHYAEIGLNTISSGTHYSAKFLLYVRKVNDAWLLQDLYLVHATNVKRLIHYQRHAEYTNNTWIFGTWRADVGTGSVSPDLSPYSLGNGMNNVLVNNIVDGDVLTRVNGKWSNVPINKVTSLAVDLTGWTSDTTSQSGTTLYKKQISVNNVYVPSPTISIGCGTGYSLPTVAEQESYNLLQYVIAENETPCYLMLYARAIPTTAFYIKVEGVD
jgi:hypothetical protein